MYIFFFHEAKKFSLTEVPTLLIFYVLAGVFGGPLWGRVAQKLGKHRTIQVACVAYAITQTVLMALPAGDFWLTAAGMAAVGFSASAFVLLIRAMVADVADELRLDTGRERSGVLFALVTMTQKFGTSITSRSSSRSWLVGLALQGRRGGTPGTPSGAGDVLPSPHHPGGDRRDLPVRLHADGGAPPRIRRSWTPCRPKSGARRGRAGAASRAGAPPPRLSGLVAPGAARVAGLAQGHLTDPASRARQALSLRRRRPCEDRDGRTSRRSTPCSTTPGIGAPVFSNIWRPARVDEACPGVAR